MGKEEARAYNAAETAKEKARNQREKHAAKVELADTYIAPLGEGQNAVALQLARELRRSTPDRSGLRVELGDGSFHEGAQARQVGFCCEAVVEGHKSLIPHAFPNAVGFTVMRGKRLLRGRPVTTSERTLLF